MGDLLLPSNWYDRLLEGAQVTLQVLGVAFVLGVVLSLVLGVARLSGNRAARGISLVWIELTRGISTIVLLFWMAFALPIILEVDQPSLLLMGSLALGINMGGYGGEIVRGAIQSVPRGQTEASIALNLTETQRLRHVIIPQAMRVILPPMGNLTKNSSLAVAIGYPDLVSVFAGTALSQTGQAIEIIAITMGVYLALSLFTSAIMSFYNWRLSRSLGA